MLSRGAPVLDRDNIGNSPLFHRDPTATRVCTPPKVFAVQAITHLPKHVTGRPSVCCLLEPLNPAITHRLSNPFFGRERQIGRP